MKILILCEEKEKTGLELLGQARRIAPDAEIVALAEDKSECLPLCGYCGADRTEIISRSGDDCAQGNRIAEQIRRLTPDAVLFPATVRGRFLSAWVAAKLGTGLTADCTDLGITREGWLKQVRPAFGGNLTAEILCRTKRPQMASVRPGVFPLQPELAERPGYSVRNISNPEGTLRLRRVAFEPAENGISLQNARVIVTGGKGLGSAVGFRKLQTLADLLGGAVGATRSAVDAGWIGYEHQIGQTGVVVHPELYIAFGVSGLIQHTVGMSASKKVIAVNKDRNAPIFRCADIGIVADWEETADEMIKMIQRRNGKT